MVVVISKKHIMSVYSKRCSPLERKTAITRQGYQISWVDPKPSSDSRKEKHWINWAGNPIFVQFLVEYILWA